MSLQAMSDIPAFEVPAPAALHFPYSGMPGADIIKSVLKRHKRRESLGFQVLHFPLRVSSYPIDPGLNHIKARHLSPAVCFSSSANVCTIPSAMASAVRLMFSSKKSLSFSLSINPTSTRTAGSAVSLRTTRFGLSLIPRSFQPTAASFLLIFSANVSASPPLPKIRLRVPEADPAPPWHSDGSTKTDPPWSCSRSAPSHMDCCIHRRLSCTPPGPPAFQAFPIS